ncbi:hypothetical protein GLAREA_07954 [Glarea lozoyensis ATCC 20868]|uniref:Uncharacterized protein n=1 Tax=Glarea lozoyensis (strain ATCC 20868 / MF5171) TaxID=1116229 RepID=S3CFS8_GLAL2|nr:uncharacterized protein GLAREA_07954 [Glarea lozoyensis ATCC 20868]EPE24104.1 hypothetical protein GLAREA_07954 [Glarea lozoyensis ATCC 20868]
MARPTRMRDVVAQPRQESRRSESPAEMRARHRRFKQNKERRQKRQAPPPPPGEDPPSAEDGVESATTPGPTSGEDSDDNKPSTSPAPAPAPTPDAQVAPTSIAAPAQTTAALPPPPPAAPVVPLISSIAPTPSPASSAPGTETTPAPVGGPQSLISNESQTLKINTPITHSSRKPLSTPAAQAPESLAQTIVPSNIPASSAPTSSAPVVTSSPSTSALPMVTSRLSTSIIAASSISAGPVLVPSASSTSSGFQLVISSSAPFSPAREASTPTAAAEVISPTGNEIISGTISTKDTNVRTAGVVVGVLLSALAIILIAWIVIRKKAGLGFRKGSKKSIDWNQEKEAPYTGTRPASSVGDEKIWGAATTAPPGSTAGPGSIAGWPAYDTTRSSADALNSNPTYQPPSAIPTPLFGGSKPTALPTYRPPQALNSSAPANRNLSLEEIAPVSPLTPPPASKWPNWRNSVATVSSLASVPRFRTIKSWVGDQRKRNARGDEVPDVPDMPSVRRYSRLE